MGLPQKKEPAVFDFGTATTIPDPGEWVRLLDQGGGDSPTAPDPEVGAIRRELAEAVSMPLQRRVVLAGHQPVIYHPGILFKHQCLKVLAEEHPDYLSAGNVVIDTDEGAGGEILYPRVDAGGNPTLHRAVLSEGGAAFLTRRVARREVVCSAFEEVFTGLQASGCDAALGGAERARDCYLARAGEPLAAAETAIRRELFPVTGVFELPLSRVIVLPSVRKFLSRCAIQGWQFFLSHNALLNRYRAEHKIKNPANPFTDLRERDGGRELLFWAIDRSSGERHPLYLSGEDGEVFAADAPFRFPLPEFADRIGDDERFIIAPKALLITLLLRTVLSDLFIHGLGGARYDAFLDLMLREEWKREPPPFVTASATRYLFESQVARLEAAKERKERERSITFHLAEHIDDPIFDEATRTELRALMDRRKEAVVELMRRKAAREAASDVNRGIKEADAGIKKILAGVFSSGEAPISPVAEKLYYTREFPYFFFLPV